MMAHTLMASAPGLRRQRPTAHPRGPSTSADGERLAADRDTLYAMGQVAAMIDRGLPLGLGTKVAPVPGPATLGRHDVGCNRSCRNPRGGTMSTRPGLERLGLSTGKKTRLQRILFRHGLENGTAIFLPYDQGLEHGPRDFFANPAAGDPAYVIKLALEGGFNGIAIQIGLAEKFYWEYAGEIPLVLKLNGKTDIPSAIDPLSPVNATVADAVRLGADAVGYTLYVGSPAQEQDFGQYLQVRQDAQRLGMPLIVWAYPRGTAIDAKGGKDSFYAVDYAARTASELGADMVKVNFPHPDKRSGVPEAYDGEFSAQQAIDAVVRSVGRSLLLVSGGERAGDEAMLEKARQSMEAGATGLIFGRNVWQREHDESLRFAARLKEILAKYPSR
jgi:fructose-bisphosphate aldolase, class I